MVKRSDQRRRDHDRKTYRLHFPSDLAADDVTAWLRAVSGTLQARPTRWGGTPTLVFEVAASSTGIEHRLRVPWQQADYVLAQLRSLVPGIRTTPEEAPPPVAWTAAVEVGLTHSGRPLRIYSPTTTAASLLASLQALEPGEQLRLQWVVAPAVPAPLPIYQRTKSDRLRPQQLLYGSAADRDEVNERRAKLSEPNLLAVLRVGAVAGSGPRAQHLIGRVRSSLASTRSPSTRFVRRWVGRKALQRRLDTAAGCVTFPMQLAAPELTALVAWPLGNPMIAGLPPVLGKQYPPSDTIPRAGLVLGTAAFPGAERPVAIGYPEALMHTWLGGSTGTGKSNVLAGLARQIMDAGYGLILMETEGNLYQAVLDYVPARRLEDVVLLDVADRQHPVGFNVLDQGQPAAVIDQIIDLFNHKFSTSLWAEEYIYHGLRTIAATPGLSFTDLPTLLLPRGEEVAWANRVTAQLTDPELQRWWQRQDSRDRRTQQQRADPVLSRVWQLASRPELRFVMGQSRSTFQIADVMAKGQILLINLKGVSKETAALAGTLIMNSVWQATKTVAKPRPTYVMLDEFADFMDLPIETESMLAQARKHQVGLILANQHLAQLTGDVREAIIANARNKLVLQTNAEDGRALAREMGSGLEPVDFTSLQLYEGIAQVLTPVGISQPVSLKTLPPERSRGQARAAIARSRAKYSRPLADVQAEIEGRHQQPRQPRSKRPTIGSADKSWGGNVVDDAPER